MLPPCKSALAPSLLRSLFRYTIDLCSQRATVAYCSSTGFYYTRKELESLKVRARALDSGLKAPGPIFREIVHFLRPVQRLQPEKERQKARPLAMKAFIISKGSLISSQNATAMT